jgi:hypothetical protein
MANFMQHQVTGLKNWLRVETSTGSEFIRIADVGLFVRNSQTLTHPATDAELFTAKVKISPYCDGEPQTWENIKGYGARLSAPGYLDCTEWSVFETEEEAREYLEEMYPEDEEDEPEQD